MPALKLAERVVIASDSRERGNLGLRRAARSVNPSCSKCQAVRRGFLTARVRDCYAAWLLGRSIEAAPILHVYCNIAVRHAFKL